jgi:uncharacterized protein (TIGR00299 family) protein
VRDRAREALRLVANEEARIHGTTVERVHLHEVGAVDAILDVVGSVWGFHLLGVETVYCGTMSLGDGFVTAAHGVLPVPAPATLRLLEGRRIRPGPDGAGELVTPTGAALVRVLSAGPPPREYVPRRSGFGAGSKDFRGRANALRIVLADDASPVGSRASEAADGIEALVVLAADVDDMTGEYLAGAAEALRGAGALDVVLLPTTMKKGRPGTRIEVLARPADVDALEARLLAETTSIGVRRTHVRRRALARETRTVRVLGHEVSVKVVTKPDGSRRAKPEYDDVRRVAQATARAAGDIFALAAAEAERA